MNVRFGLYFIPDIDTDLYAVGSRVVGYDVRRRQEMVLPDFIAPDWTGTARQFGFHATITDAITTTEDRIPEVFDRTEQVLSSLRRDNRYLLTKERVGFWRDASTMAAVILRPNRSVEMLHDVLVTSLHPMGIGSQYYDDYLKDPEGFQQGDAAAIQKTKLFYSPYIFDEFVPHFTCVQAYGGSAEGRAELERKLESLFKEVDQIEITKLAFVVQKENESYFTIVKEFPISG